MELGWDAACRHVEMESWEDTANDNQRETMAKQNVFQPGYVYTANLTVEAETGYELTENTEGHAP